MNIPPRTRIVHALAGGEPAKEQTISKAIRLYMERYYPEIRFRFDALGLAHTKAQAGQFAAINPWRAWPDFWMFWPNVEGKTGLCLELKVAGTSLRMKQDGTKYRILRHEKKRKAEWFEDPNDRRVKLTPKGADGKFMKPVFDTKIRKAGDWADAHIEEQAEMLAYLRTVGYVAEFGVGLEESLTIIENYINA